tara:strand:+ start:3029 stop:3214 length:186 start_codon:yes stop_codon:yes gene_type:complete
MNITEVGELIEGKERKLESIKFEMDAISPWDDDWCDLAEIFIKVARDRNRILNHVSGKNNQ